MYDSCNINFITEYEQLRKTKEDKQTKITEENKEEKSCVQSETHLI